MHNNLPTVVTSNWTEREFSRLEVEPAKASCRDERSGVFVNYASLTYNLDMMLFVYRKNEREDLTTDQLKFSRQLIKEYLE